MVPYSGSGPYCYAHSLAMMLGAQAPPVGVIETVTGSPFGMQLVGGTTPFFDPYGWDPDLGLDAAVELLGWACAREDGGSPEEALDRLRAAAGPVLAGPVDMALLPYTPGGGGDHYLVVLEVEDATVAVHDPHGHPYATLPVADFLAAWRADAVAYTRRPFVMRHRFARLREVDAAEALRASLPAAVTWLAGRDDLAVPPGSLGGAAAALRLAELAERGLDVETWGLLAHFGVRVGARRLADAAACLASLRLAEPASVATAQARLVGGLQYPLVTGDGAALATGLRRLAPGYERLRATLAGELAAGL